MASYRMVNRRYNNNQSSPWKNQNDSLMIHTRNNCSNESFSHHLRCWCCRRTKQDTSTNHDSRSGKTHPNFSKCTKRATENVYDSDTSDNDIRLSESNVSYVLQNIGSTLTSLRYTDSSTSSNLSENSYESRQRLSRQMVQSWQRSTIKALRRDRKGINTRKPQSRTVQSSDTFDSCDETEESQSATDYAGTSSTDSEYADTVEQNPGRGLKFQKNNSPKGEFRNTISRMRFSNSTDIPTVTLHTKTRSQNGMQTKFQVDQVKKPLSSSPDIETTRMNPKSRTQSEMKTQLREMEKPLSNGTVIIPKIKTQNELKLTVQSSRESKKDQAKQSRKKIESNRRKITQTNSANPKFKKKDKKRGVFESAKLGGAFKASTMVAFSESKYILPIVKPGRRRSTRCSLSDDSVGLENSIRGSNYDIFSSNPDFTRTNSIHNEIPITRGILAGSTTLAFDGHEDAHGSQNACNGSGENVLPRNDIACDSKKSVSFELKNLNGQLLSSTHSAQRNIENNRKVNEESALKCVKPQIKGGLDKLTVPTGKTLAYENSLDSLSVQSEPLQNFVDVLPQSSSSSFSKTDLLNKSYSQGLQHKTCGKKDERLLSVQSALSKINIPNGSDSRGLKHQTAKTDVGTDPLSAQPSSSKMNPINGLESQGTKHQNLSKTDTGTDPFPVQLDPSNMNVPTSTATKMDDKCFDEKNVKSLQQSSPDSASIIFQKSKSNLDSKINSIVPSRDLSYRISENEYLNCIAENRNISKRLSDIESDQWANKTYTSNKSLAFENFDFSSSTKKLMKMRGKKFSSTRLAESNRRSTREILRFTPFGWSLPSPNSFNHDKNSYASKRRFEMGDHAKQGVFRPRKQTGGSTAKSAEFGCLTSLYKPMQRRSSTTADHFTRREVFSHRKSEDTLSPRVKSNTTSHDNVMIKNLMNYKENGNSGFSEISFQAASEYLESRLQKIQPSRAVSAVQNVYFNERHRNTGNKDTVSERNGESLKNLVHLRRETCSCNNIKDATSYESIYSANVSSSSSSCEKNRDYNRSVGKSFLKEIVGSIIFGPKIDDVICSSIDTFKSMNS